MNYSVDISPKDQNVFGFVYKIVNKINSKVYIGQTTLSVKRRFDSHHNSPSSSCLIDRSIRKHGRDNFSYQIIDVAFDSLHLDQLEIKHISEYKKTYKLYNISIGGQYNSRMTDDIRKKISKALSGRKKTPEHTEKVRQSNLGKKRSKEVVEKHKNFMTKLKGREIIIVDINGNIKEYNSIGNACQDLNLIKQKIRHSLNKRYIIDNKYIVFYKENFDKNKNYLSYFYNFYLKKDQEILYFKSLREMFLKFNTSERQARKALITKQYLNYEFGEL